jgi:hypothetical protein
MVLIRVLAADVALQITVVVEVPLTLVAARRSFGTTIDFFCTKSVFGILHDERVWKTRGDTAKRPHCCT